MLFSPLVFDGHNRLAITPVLLITWSMVIFPVESNLRHVSPGLHLAVENTIEHIIQRYYDDSEITIQQCARNEQFAQVDIVNGVLGRLRNHLVRVENPCRMPGVSFEDRASLLNVIFVDGIRSFQSILEHLAYITREPLALFSIVLTNTNSADDEQNLVQWILDLCWSKYMVNVIVVPMTSPDDTSSAVPIYSYFPFGPGYCEQVRPVVISGFPPPDGKPSADLFPDKLQNLYGCPLIVSTYSFVPYIILGPDRSNGSTVQSGIDDFAIRALAQYLRFRLVYLVQRTRGMVFTNGSSTGSLGQVIQGKANISIGGLGISKDRIKFARVSTFLYFTPVSFALTPMTPYSSLETLFLPFTKKLWLVMSALLVFTSLFLVSLKFVPSIRRTFFVGTNNRAPILNMVAMLFGVSLPSVPARNFARFLLLIWLCTMFVVRNSYQANLFVLMQKDLKPKSPVTIGDLVTANYTFMGEPSAFGFFRFIVQQGGRLEPYEGQYESLRNTIPNATRKLAFIVSSTVIVYFNRMHFRQGTTIDVPKKQLMVVPSVFYLNRQSCLENAINRKLWELVSGGFVDYWQEVHYAPPPDNLLRNDESLEPKQLSWGQVNGIYQLQAALSAVSVIVFGLEVLSRRVASLRVIFDNLIY